MTSWWGHAPAGDLLKQLSIRMHLIWPSFLQPLRLVLLAVLHSWQPPRISLLVPFASSLPLCHLTSSAWHLFRLSRHPASSQQPLCQLLLPFSLLYLLSFSLPPMPLLPR